MTKNKTLATAGILTALFYVIGFVVLFILNPQAYEELNNLSLAAYNIVGMDYRWYSVVAYLIVGILNLIFCSLLFLMANNKSLAIVGKIFLLISGLLWFSFGVYPYNPMTDNMSNHILVIRVLALLVTSFSGLLFFGGEFETISKDKFLKWYTLSSGLVILLLSLLRIFIYNDETWIRANISITIYFVWFGVFGLRTLSYFKRTPV